MTTQPSESSYQRRNAKARAAGFRSYAQVRSLGGTKQVTAQRRRLIDRLPTPARETRNLAIEAVAAMRREGMSLDRAAAEMGITVDAVRFWAAVALRRDGSPRSADRMLRTMVVVSDGQLRLVDVRGNYQASLAGAHLNAIGKFLDTGDTSQLRSFEGKRVGGVELETDPDLLEDMALRSQLGFEDIYSLGA